MKNCPFISGPEGCASDLANCVSKTVGFLLGPLTVLANLASGGAAKTIIATAAKAAKAATTAAKAARRAKQAWAVVDNAGTAYGAADATYKAATAKLMTEAETCLESFTSKRVYDMVGYYYPPNGPDHKTIARAWAEAYLAADMKANSAAYADEMIATIDPTGVVGMVQGFLMDDCKDLPESPIATDTYINAHGMKGLVPRVATGTIGPAGSRTNS